MRNAGKIITVAAVAAALTACSPPSEQPSDLPPGADPTTSAQPSPTTQQGKACTAEDIEATPSGNAEGYEVTIPRDCERGRRVADPGVAARKRTRRQVRGRARRGLHDRRVVGRAGEGELLGELGTLSVQLGEDQPGFQGWDEALQGAQQGSQHLIVVPENMSFAQESNHPLYGETLVVVAEVVDIAQVP